MRIGRSTLLFFAVNTALLFSCTEESPFLSKDEAARIADDLNKSRDPFHFVKDVAAIINNDVYYFNRLDSIPRRLTNTPSGLKTEIRLSHDKSQIAYLNGNGHPVIIRADNGAVVAVLTQYEFIDQMDWAKDRLTLYMLIDREVYFHGAPMEFIQPESFHPWDDLNSFSMNSIGDQGYFIRYYGGTTAKNLIYHSEKRNIDKTFNLIDGDLFDYIDFYDNKGNFLLGYHDYVEDGFSRIICIQDYNFLAKYEWDFETMKSPAFNADHEILLYGTVENKYQIKAVYLGTSAYDGNGIYDVLTRVLEDYTSTTPIYLDWVQ